jgi:subtilisin family serine protease
MAAPTDLGEAPSATIQTEDLDPDDLRTLARDADVVSIAPVMPTRLIEPVPAGASSGGGPAAASTTAWGISAVKADVSTFDGSGVTVAVLDTGIDAGHLAFQGATLHQQDFSGAGNGDVNGHGTHCAGTIFGRSVGGTRIGVAPGVQQAFIGKVLGNDGRGDSEMIFRAIQWAVDGGAHVISMSLGFDFPGLVEHLHQNEGLPIPLATSLALEGYRGNLRMFDALMGMIRARGAFGLGTLVVAASGNESQREVDPDWEIAAGLPAAAEGVISVGALQQDGSSFSVASFSNTLCQMSAPGVNILSAKAGGGLFCLNGTSMACPHVAGVAALWWQAIAQLPVPRTAGTVLARLLSGARTGVFSAGVDVADRGAGLVTAP